MSKHHCCDTAWTDTDPSWTHNDDLNKHSEYRVEVQVEKKLIFTTRVFKKLCSDTCVSMATVALVVVNQLFTVKGARSMARLGLTFIQISLTVFPNKSCRAGARVLTNTIHTLSSITAARLPGTRIRRTIVFIHLTLDPYCGNDK